MGRGWPGGWIGLAAAALMAGQAGPALAQHSAETAAGQAEDAFGGSVGQETIGIYSDTDVRGFNPQQAGNVRVDEVYVDLLYQYIQRVKLSTAVRVGFSALDYPFPAPSGIVAHRNRRPGDRFALSLGANEMQYGGYLLYFDTELPVLKDHFGIAAGAGYANLHNVDGASVVNLAYGLVPVAKVGGVEIMGVASGVIALRGKTRPLTVTTGPFLPPIPPVGRYLGQDWAHNEVNSFNQGVFVRAPLGGGLRFRGGVFQSRSDKKRNFTELFVVQDATGLSRHFVYSDPHQDSYANSWEGQIAWQHVRGALRQTLLAAARGRHRHIESGGSDISSFGLVQLGQPDPEPKPAAFVFGPVNVSELKQTNISVGYLAVLRDRGQVNLGLTKSRYRSASGRTESRADPWLYNASALVDLNRRVALYAGYVSGLEDSGSAPENAANRNEQLPASHTSQMDAGVKFSVGRMRVIASGFQLKKPYFSFDAANRYTPLGQLKLQGLEASATGNLTARLHMVGGILFMNAVVRANPGAEALVGRRPVGLPDIHARIDASYRTDVHGVTLLATLFHDGRRAASAAPYAQLGGKQLFLPSNTTLDLGFRRNFKAGGHPVSLRVMANNVFNSRRWKAIASNTLQADEARRYNVYLLADF